MRVSERQRYTLTNHRIEDARDKNAGVLEKLSTLRDINRISDNPVGAGQEIRSKARINNTQQYRRNIDYSKGFLERTETAIVGIAENLIRAKELGIAMSNSTYDSQSRKAAAHELQQITDQVIALGNSTYQDKYVFSGYRTNTPALSDTGEFLGDDGSLYLQIDDHDFRQINIPGRNLFEPSSNERGLGHFNLTDSLFSMLEGMETDDLDLIRRSIDELDFQVDKVTSTQASLGALTSALSTSGKFLELDEDLSRDQLSRITEVDTFKATSDFHRTEATLQSTLLASNKLLQPSLLNFMQ